MPSKTIEPKTMPPGGLSASANPSARLQQLLRQDTSLLSQPIDTEITKDGNNEGNFIVSELPLGEATKEITEETPVEFKEKTRKQIVKQPPKLSLKQSFKYVVLESGNEREEKITKTRLNVDIDEDLHMWLKGHAIQNRRKLNDLIPRILKAYRDEVEE